MVKYPGSVGVQYRCFRVGYRIDGYYINSEGNCLTDREISRKGEAYERTRKEAVVISGMKRKESLQSVSQKEDLGVLNPVADLFSAFTFHRPPSFML